MFKANEVERINVYVNPLGDQSEEVDASINAYIRQFLAKQKQLADFTRFAWELSPELAVHLPTRFRALSTVRLTAQELVRANPDVVSHMPEALLLFVGESPLAFETLDATKLSYIITWQHCSPVVALSLLCKSVNSRV